MKEILIVFSLMILSCNTMKTTIIKEKFKFESGEKGRRITFETSLDCPAEEVWKIYERPNGWLENLNPNAKLIWKKRQDSTSSWSLNSEYSFSLYMYGFIPFGKHYISFEDIDNEEFSLQSREHGFMVPHWDNFFQIIPTSNSTCKIRDVLEIQSNGINALVAFYAIDVFNAKHKKLVKKFNS